MEHIQRIKEIDTLLAELSIEKEALLNTYYKCPCGSLVLVKRMDVHNHTLRHITKQIKKAKQYKLLKRMALEVAKLSSDSDSDSDSD